MTVPKINSAHGSDTRNIINRAIEVLNQQGISIQDLVAEGQLTEEQYENLIIVINGLLKSGEVGEYDLTPELLIKIKNKATTQKVLDEKSAILESVGKDIDEVNSRMISNTVDLKLFGAKGDGSDDSIKIQEALDYIDAKGGGTLYVPGGYEFGVTSTLTVGSNTKINGMGTIRRLSALPREFLRTKNGFHGDGHTGYDANKNIVIEDITVNLGGYEVNGLVMAHAKSIQIKNVKGIGVGLHLVDLIGVKNAVIDINTIDSNGITSSNYSAIQIDQAVTGAASFVNTNNNSCENIVVSQNDIQNNQSPTGGIQLHRGTKANPHKNIIISGNQFKDVRYPIYKDAGTYAKTVSLLNNTGESVTTGIRLLSEVENLILKGNNFDDASDRGIEVRGTSANKTKFVNASDNIFSGVGSQGMSFIHCEFMVVDNNIINNKGKSGSNIRALVLSNTSKANLRGNMIAGGSTNFNAGIQLLQSDGRMDEINIYDNFIEGAQNIFSVVGNVEFEERNNSGRTDYSSGTVTLGATYPDNSVDATVVHGLSASPTPPKLQDVTVTPSSPLGNATKFWVSDMTGSSFKINIDQPHGVSGGVDFVWNARR